MSPALRPEVLHYLGYDQDDGGIVTLVRNLAATDRFDCVLGQNVGATQRRRPELPVAEFPAVVGERISLGNAFATRRAALAVRRWLAADARRIFHGHSRAGLLVALWLHAWGERRVVVSVHCYGRQRWFYRWAAARLGARLFWLSPAMRTYYGVPGDGWSQCVPEATTPSSVTPAPALEGRLRLGGAGALVGWKRWDLVIEALARLPENLRTRVTFEHIGGGGERPALEALARARGVAEQVRFCGNEGSSERLLGAIDALVVASENEPFSLAMLEALAAGVPVLAADSGGARDVIRAGENGFLFRTGDAADLARRLELWLASPPTWDRAAIRRTPPQAADIAVRWTEIYAQLG